ncbi:MAG TPA: CYTH domain-containing protein [Puia sp.]
MGIEIERKYLVDINKWNNSVKGDKHYCRQGYILINQNINIRIRLVDGKGYLTIKGHVNNFSRLEFEYEIPEKDAEELLAKFCTSEINKIRYKVPYKGKLWEVDEFLGSNLGLIVAEIELTNEFESFDLPDWVYKEVTGDQKYYNSNLSILPYKSWQKDM